MYGKFILCIEIALVLNKKVHGKEKEHHTKAFID